MLRQNECESIIRKRIQSVDPIKAAADVNHLQECSQLSLPPAARVIDQIIQNVPFSGRANCLFEVCEEVCH